MSLRRRPCLDRAEKTKDLRRLPITSKPSSCRTAHSRSASEDERGRHHSRSSRSSSEQGRPELMEMTREPMGEPTTPMLVNFTVDDFTAVSHTTNSILFTSWHPYTPGWVQIRATSDQDRVRCVPCQHDPEQEEEIGRRRRLEVEPHRAPPSPSPRQELLAKAGQSSCDAPKVYRYDFAARLSRDAPCGTKVR